MTEPMLSRLQHLMTVREEVESLGELPRSPGTDWPAADWVDEGTHLSLFLDVPGVEPERLEMQDDGETLTLAGERPELPGNLIYQERRSGPFARTLNFPEPVVPGSGQAQLSAGVLRVRFEKLHPTIDAVVSSER
ncbi:Hsp20/alpha crystallin family protein [Deinococcus lacus]|uniref:Hsp20/alpha crystallin family protein n=1 Tax=Deinococcus lacus TaxID=392561 RepID=A0ABW1YAB9_9DEIO